MAEKNVGMSKEIKLLSNMRDSSPKPPRAGRRPATWRTLLFVALLLLAVWVLNRLLRPIVAPWSLPDGGAPAMLGEWSGQVVLADGTTGMLVLALADNFDEQEGWTNLTIEGTARYCLGSSRGSFQVYGQADRQGHVADLRFRPEEDEPVLLLHAMSSRWEEGRILLSGTSSYDPAGTHIALSDVPEPAISIALEPGPGKDCPATSP